MMTLLDLLAPTYRQMLSALSAWLDKAVAHCPDDDGEALLSARLAPDMFPLATQIRFACVQALEGIARLRGFDTPTLAADLLDEGRAGGERPGTFADAQARIAETLALVEELSAFQHAVDPDAPIAHELPSGMIFDLTMGQYARDWALPQFSFHLMTAYAILRNQGVPLGKADYVGHLKPYVRTSPAAD